MKKLILILALAAGLFAGYIDLLSSELLIPILLVLGFAFIFAYLLPSIAWRLALLVGIGVPLVVLAAYYFGYEPAFVDEIKKRMPDFDYNISDALESLLAFIPSFLGAYGGMVLRKFLGGMVGKKE